MTIGINAAAAIKQPRTGVEEYTYQLIKHLTMLPEVRAHRFFLYVPEVKENPSTRPSMSSGFAQGISPEQSGAESKANPFNFPLPPNFEIKILRWPWPFLWTQIRLAWEIFRRPPEVLFIPVHVLPLFAPKNSIVTIHGLEYEYFPQYYSWWRRVYLKWTTAHTLERARRLIAVSENTKQDLIKLCGVKAEKISAVHHGVSSRHPDSAMAGEEACSNERSGIRQRSFASLRMTGEKPYILYVGRIETKKNIQGILEAYKILKEQYKIPHELILAGAPGYGYKNFHPAGGRPKGEKLKIKELGYVDDVTKWQLLLGAEIFLFPSFYEGFGLPVLEAQAMGVPVVTSLGSCLSEIAGQGALFVNPRSSVEIARAVKQLIDDKILRDKLIQLGRENIKRFSWEKCAKETLEIMTRV